MTIDVQIFSALNSLAGGRVYPDIADVAPEELSYPYITFQQVGGSALNFLEGTCPDCSNARVQINVWGVTRLSVSDVAEQVEKAMRSAAQLQTTVLGARVSLYESDTKLRGSRQDFSVWY